MIQMINSKKKGNRFELVIAKLLTEKTGFKWYRVGVSSGARYTTQGAEKYRGDVTTDDKEYIKYIIETKATKSRVSLEDVVNPKSKFNEWIEQCIRETDNDNWTLFFKANNGKIFGLEPLETDFAKRYFDKPFMVLNKKYNLFFIE
jgi:hypothetical protein